MPAASATIAERWAALARLRAFRRDRLGMLQRLSAELGDIGLFYLGPRPIVLVNSSAYAHAVLVEQDAAFHKGPGLAIYARPVLGNGLLTSEDELHRRQRRLVAPAFRQSRIAAYADVMADYAERAQRAWADGLRLDAARAMMGLTLEIVAKTLFDSEVAGEADALGRALTVAMRHVTSETTALLHLPLHWPTPRNKRVRAAVARLDATIYRIMRERRAANEDRGDLISMLLMARDEDDGGGMSDDQVRDEAMTIFLAGHETTADALAWTWYLLAQHPGVLARLQAELDGVLAGRTPTLDDLPRLPYTLQVLKESLRLYPPAYAVVRQALRAVDLDGFQVPAGAVVVVSIYTMHRRADYFPAPERFDPDRFTPAAERGLPRYAYLPFGAGPRVCIGNHFAMMEGHIVLATLAQRVALELVHGRRVGMEPLITLRPSPGIPMIVRRRDAPGRVQGARSHDDQARAARSADEFYAASPLDSPT